MGYEQDQGDRSVTFSLYDFQSINSSSKIVLFTTTKLPYTEIYLIMYRNTTKLREYVTS